jgi:hypothetical protein
VNGTLDMRHWTWDTGHETKDYFLFSIYPG